ncbi:TPA: hypothetical protein ACK1LG_005312 [Klebsiella pneumoniae]
MNDVENKNVDYLSKVLSSPKFFIKKRGKFQELSNSTKFTFCFIVLNPISGIEKFTDVYERLATSLNTTPDNKYLVKSLLELSMFDLVKTNKLEEDCFSVVAVPSDSIILSEEIKLDAFLSNLPESYVSHYLYIKHHQGIVDNKLTMTIEEISKATGVNASEIGFMNKLFKEMGYFSITKETKTGTNIYEVIK